MKRRWFLVGAAGLLVCVGLAGYKTAARFAGATEDAVADARDGASIAHAHTPPAPDSDAALARDVVPTGVTPDIQAKNVDPEGEETVRQAAREDVNPPRLPPKPHSEEAYDSAEELLVAIRDRGKIGSADIAEFAQLQRQMNLADVAASTRQLRELLRSLGLDTSALAKKQ